MDDYISLNSPTTSSSPLSPDIQDFHLLPSSKVCGVCGDKALGCNFNAVTCESCKAFFRRNALKGKNFICPFNNCCKIDAVTRRFCQKCRMKKCFDIGMKKEFIMSEEERTVKRKKIEENRIKKIKHKLRNTNCNKKGKQQLVHMLNRSYEKISEESSFSDSDISASPLGDSPESFQSRGSLSPLKDTHTAQLCPSTQHKGMPSKIQTVDEQRMDNGFMNLESVDSLLNTAIRAEYNVKLDLVQIDDDNSRLSPVPLRVRDRQLNKVEGAKLQELVIANKALDAPLSEDGRLSLCYDIDDPSLLNVLNLTDIAIRRMIKMAKKLVAFKTLCQEDQIALLKGSCTELMILRSIMSYDAEKGCWKIPHTDSHTNHIKMEVLKEARGNVYEEHQRFIQSFDASWRSDEKIMLLLSAIILFDCNRPNIVHRDVIQLEQESYFYLLRRYLESVVSGCQARSMYLKLIGKISELHILNDKHVRVYMDVNPKEVEPLLIEIFDLKKR